MIGDRSVPDTSMGNDGHDGRCSGLYTTSFIAI